MRFTPEMVVSVYPDRPNERHMLWVWKGLGESLFTALQFQQACQDEPLDVPAMRLMAQDWAAQGWGHWAHRMKGEGE